jgi:Uma2 family endonuclease
LAARRKERLMITQELAQIAPTRRRFSREEFHRMADLGLFGPEERLELLDGEIIRMNPIGVPHFVATKKTRSALSSALSGLPFVLFKEDPIILGDDGELVPDVQVVRGTEADYNVGFPKAADAVLVVEVSDTTLRFDRGKPSSPATH